MSNWYLASFANGHTIKLNAGRRYYGHAWHARGRHKLTGEPWSLQGFSAQGGEKTERIMRTMINFAPTDCVAFAEVVAVEACALTTAE